MDKTDNAITQAAQAIQARQQPAPLPQTTSTSTLRGDDLSREQREAVNYFYGRIKSVYGSKFKAQFPSVEDQQLSKREWAGQVANLSPADIDRGIGKLKEKIVAGDKEYQWPNIPLAAALCQPKPEDFGLPSLDAAWAEAESNAHHVDKHSWSHEAVRVAGKRACWFDIMSALGGTRRRELKGRFARHYDYLVERVMNNKPVEGGRQLLESDKNKPSKPMAEKNEDYHTRQQQKAMEDMGINPKGGRAEFLKRMKGMGL